MRILETIYRMMRQAKDLEASKRLTKVRHAIFVKKEDLQILLVTDKEKRVEIEKSNVYIGYKLLWVIDMFLQGKKFPNSQLTDLQWRCYIYDIVVFISVDEYLSEMLEFDSKMFFRVIQELFRGRAWKFLSEMRKYVRKEDCISADSIFELLK